MTKWKTILAFGLIALATAVLALMLLNSYLYHWLDDGLPLSVCFWALLSVAYTFNGMKVGRLILVCRALALALLALGVAALFAALPGWLAQTVQVLCFVVLGVICMTSIVNTVKDRKAKKAEEMPSEESV